MKYTISLCVVIAANLAWADSIEPSKSFDLVVTAGKTITGYGQLDGDDNFSIQGVTVKASSEEEAISILRERHPGKAIYRDYDTSIPTPVEDAGDGPIEKTTSSMNDAYPLNDPFFSQQAHFRPFQEHLPGEHGFLEIRDYLKGKVRIGVLDSDFMDHFEVSIKEGRSFYEDTDPWTYVRQEGDTSCLKSHGHSVASVIAAASDNEFGGAGILPEQHVDLVAGVIGSCGSGKLSAMAQGIAWMSGQEMDGGPAISKPVDVINLSWGSIKPDSCPGFLQDAIDFAARKNIPVVVSGGNNGIPAKDYTLANCNNTIAVGSIEPNGEITSFSNYGAGIDVYALGRRVVVSEIDEDGYVVTGTLNGTSFSAPMVASMVAAIKSYAPHADNARIMNLLRTDHAKVNYGNCSADVCGSPTLHVGSTLDAMSGIDAVSATHMLSVDSECQIMQYIRDNAKDLKMCESYEVSSSLPEISDEDAYYYITYGDEWESDEPIGMIQTNVMKGPIRVSNEHIENLGYQTCVSGDCSEKTKIEITGKIPEFCQ